MDTRLGVWIGAMTLALVATGCGASAASLRRGSWSGELALHGPIVEAQYAAHDAMLAHCGGRVRIVDGAQAERIALVDTGAGNAHAVSRDTTGRRIHYVCVSRAPTEFRTAHDETSATASVGSASEL